MEEKIRGILNKKSGLIEPKSLMLFGQYLLFSIFVYFSKICNELPNPDSIWQGMMYKESWTWECGLGRYMIGVCQVLRSYIVNPVMVTLVGLVFLAVVCVYIIKIFNIKSTIWQLVVGGIIIISPTVGSILTYYYCSDMYMLSYLLSVLAVWYLAKGKKVMCVLRQCVLWLQRQFIRRLLE